MTKKLEVPKDFNIDNFLSGDEISSVHKEQSVEATERIIKKRKSYSEDIDEEALLAELASRETKGLGYILPKKEKQNDKEKERISESPSSTEQNLQSKEPLSDKPTFPRPSSKQRKASLQEYRQTFLSVPKITDRKTVFVSSSLREKIVAINLRFGTEKSSVSGFIENLVIHHLEEYKEDLDNWKKL